MKNNPYKLTATAKKWFFEDRRVDGDKTYYYMGDMGYPYPTVDDQWLTERVLFVFELRRSCSPVERLRLSHKPFAYKEVFSEDANKEMWQRWQSLRALNIQDVEVFRTLLHQ